MPHRRDGNEKKQQVRVVKARLDTAHRCGEAFVLRASKSTSIEHTRNRGHECVLDLLTSSVGANEKQWRDKW